MEKVTIFYDNWCPNCRGFNHLVKKLDFFNLIETKALRSEEEIRSFPDIDLKLATEQMASQKNGKWFYGFNSMYMVLTRLPLLALFCPILLFLKITKIGQYLYIKLAVNRRVIPLHCDKEHCEVKK